MGQLKLKIFWVIFPYQSGGFRADHISKHREESCKYDVGIRAFLMKVEMVDIVVKYCLECLIFSIDTNIKHKTIQIYANQDQISKYRFGHGFSCLTLMNYR